MDELSGIWSLSPLAALVGFIALVGMLIARGQLVTRREVEARVAAVQQGNEDAMKATNDGNDKVLAQYAERIEDYKGREAALVQEKADWKEAYQTEVQTSSEWQAQAEALTAVGRTTQHIVESLPVTPQDGGHAKNVGRVDGS